MAVDAQISIYIYQSIEIILYIQYTYILFFKSNRMYNCLSVYPLGSQKKRLGRMFLYFEGNFLLVQEIQNFSWCILNLRICLCLDLYTMMKIQPNKKFDNLTYNWKQLPFMNIHRKTRMTKSIKAKLWNGRTNEH